MLFPGSEGGRRVNLRKLIGTAIVLILIYWIVTQPDDAAGSVESIAGTLQGWAENVTSFFGQLAN